MSIHLEGHLRNAPTSIRVSVLNDPAARERWCRPAAAPKSEPTSPKWGPADIARHVIQRNLNAHFLSYVVAQRTVLTKSFGPSFHESNGIL
jgi:hypothetical protein